jgi:hypothetical protein
MIRAIGGAGSAGLDIGGREKPPPPQPKKRPPAAMSRARARGYEVGSRFWGGEPLQTKPRVGRSPTRGKVARVVMRPRGNETLFTCYNSKDNST